MQNNKINKHIPVMLNQIKSFIPFDKKINVIDATFGGGGYSGGGGNRGSSPYNATGGGGGSYNGGSNTTNTAGSSTEWSDHGKVTITVN